MPNRNPEPNPNTNTNPNQIPTVTYRGFTILSATLSQKFAEVAVFTAALDMFMNHTPHYGLSDRLLTPRRCIVSVLFLYVCFFGVSQLGSCSGL